MYKRQGQLTAPLRDRFGVVLRLEMYTPEELATIVSRSAKILGIETNQEGALEIASRSRGTVSYTHLDVYKRQGDNSLL